MESRKRPLTDGDEASVTKKRIVTGANGSPKVNGHEDVEEDSFAEKLELFRKEAIWRRMKHYSREHERSQVRIQELERRKSTCEAGLAAMSACWAQIIETIRSLVKPDDLPQVDIHAKEIFDLTSHIQQEPVGDLANALGSTVHATKALLTRFAQLQGDHRTQSQHPDATMSDGESVALRSELNALRARLSDCENQRDQYYTALATAENKLVRSQSKTVRELEANMRKAHGDSGSEGPGEVHEKGSSPAATPTPPQANGVQDSADVDALREQLRAREQKVLELERETALLRDQNMLLELDAKNMSAERVRSTPVYDGLEKNYQLVDAALREKEETVRRLEGEIYQLRDSRATWEQGVMNAAKETLLDLKTMLAKRDTENLRLREQREQQTAELMERKQRDTIKFNSLSELKKIAEYNRERVKVLKSEVARCRARLAAQAGDESLMRFLLDDRNQGNVEEDVNLLKAYRDQTLKLENRVGALERSLGQIQNEHPDIAVCLKAQADAFTELATLKKELERYKQTFGNLSKLPPDVSQLVEQLRAKEDEVQRLRLVEEQFIESEKALFAEVERLSTAWEDQERQLKDRAFNLAAMDERLVKLSNEKAKSENKYFAIMREKEAGDNERQKLVKTVDKQDKAIARMQELDSQHKQHINSYDQEIRHLRKKIELLQSEITSVRVGHTSAQAELEMERKRSQDVATAVGDRDRDINTKRQELRVKEDELVRLRKDLERQLADAKRAAREAKDSKSKNLEANMNKDLERVAFCSTCRSGLRSTIITKCMHTFCRECVDARLQTRQRKCPCCNLAFGQQDVQTFFFN